LLNISLKTEDNVKFRHTESGKVIEISRWNGTIGFPFETKNTCDFHGSLGTLLFAQFYAWKKKKRYLHKSAFGAYKTVPCYDSCDCSHFDIPSALAGHNQITRDEMQKWRCAASTRSRINGAIKTKAAVNCYFRLSPRDRRGTTHKWLVRFQREHPTHTGTLTTYRPKCREATVSLVDYLNITVRRSKNRAITRAIDDKRCKLRADLTQY